MHPPDPEQSLQPARDCRLGRLPLVPSQCVLEFGCGAVSDHMRILD